MIIRFPIIFLLFSSAVFCILIFSTCERKHVSDNTGLFTNSDSARFYRFINMGDSAYAEKLSFHSFSVAKKYYDSAAYIAENINDSTMIAEAIFATGRVYDAWNKEPKKTISYFMKAAEIMSRQPTKGIRSLYVKVLSAHAYDKIKDSVNASLILEGLYEEIYTKPDSIKKKMIFIPEMALIATEVKNYQLAERILANLYKRSWIVNDPVTLNYLDHYYLTKSRIALNKREYGSLYTDSLAAALTDSTNVIDLMYYSREISDLYEKAGNPVKALAFKKISTDASEKLNIAEGINSMENRLLQSELENEKSKRLLSEKGKQNRQIITWGLFILLLITSILFYGIYKNSLRYRKQSIELSDLNEDLGAKVEQISLLNKEIQHRVKNNLQTILSLLQMQERRSDNEEAVAELQNAAMRIESIASLHNQLNAGAAEQKIDFKKYISEVAHNIVTCVANNKQVITHLDIGGIVISPEKNFSLALLFNEWITNSIKYAIPEKSPLAIYLSIQSVNGNIFIEYYDNGNLKMSPGKRKEGLGKEIITLLSAQLKGTLKTVPGKPYHYTLTLPYG